MVASAIKNGIPRLQKGNRYCRIGILISLVAVGLIYYSFFLSFFLYFFSIPEVDAHRSMVSMTPGEIAGLVIGFLLAALICMIFTWRRWREHKVLR